MWKVLKTFSHFYSYYKTETMGRGWVKKHTNI